jgi:transcriptional regulator with XRE-family HTH domain
MVLGQRIKKLRELKNLTQEYMADQLKMNQGSYSKLESGETDIPYSRLEQISEVLGLRVEDVIGFNESIVFNLINNKKANGLVINQVSKNEKRLYEEYIEALKNENKFLKTLVNKQKKKPTKKRKT